eukprot:3822985-Pyramimonas_sp.AAC.1
MRPTPVLTYTIYVERRAQIAATDRAAVRSLLGRAGQLAGGGDAHASGAGAQRHAHAVHARRVRARPRAGRPRRRLVQAAAAGYPAGGQGDRRRQ